MDSYTSVGCVKFSLLRTEYLWFAVSVLTNSPKRFYITEKTFFQLKFFTVIIESDKGSVLQISTVTVCDRLQCVFSKSFLKREFLDIYLKTSFGVRNFWNT